MWNKEKTVLFHKQFDDKWKGRKERYEFYILCFKMMDFKMRNIKMLALKRI